MGTAGQATFYLDGAAVGGGPRQAAAAMNTSYPPLIGAQPAHSSLGGLEEAAVCNRALSAAEILTRYQKG